MVFKSFLSFPFLSVIDLRHTGCSFRRAPELAGFAQSANHGLFVPTPLATSYSMLEELTKSPLYPCPIASSYRLDISRLYHHASANNSHVLGNDTKLALNPHSGGVTPSLFYRRNMKQEPILTRSTLPDPLALERTPPPWNTSLLEPPQKL
ncbi:hypothetical protein CONPUDRAFT_79876, partial [Coniophora puteana RWD-64-598 SS2]